MIFKVVRLFILTLFLISPTFADCYDALHKQAEDIKERRWKACFKEGPTIDLDKKSSHAVDHVSLKTSTLSDEYANGKERIEVLKILWQRWDVIQYGLGYDNLNFNRSDADPRRQAHFCALHVMMQGITALYNDPTLGVEDGVFFKHMADYGRTADQALKNYYTEKALKTLFPKGFFDELLQCGAMNHDSMEKIKLSAAIRGKKITAKGYDFFAQDNRETTYTYASMDQGPLTKVSIHKEVSGNPVEEGDLFYLKPVEKVDPMHKAFYDFYTRKEGGRYQIPKASLEDAFMHVFHETAHMPMSTLVTCGGSIQSDDKEKLYYPQKWVLGKGDKTLGDYLAFLGMTGDFATEKVRQRLERSMKEVKFIHEDWVKILRDLGLKYFDAPSNQDFNPASYLKGEVIDFIQTMSSYSKVMEYLWDNRHKAIGEVFKSPASYHSFSTNSIREERRIRRNHFMRKVQAIGFRDMMETLKDKEKSEHYSKFEKPLKAYLENTGGFKDDFIKYAFVDPKKWHALSSEQKDVILTNYFSKVAVILLKEYDELSLWSFNSKNWEKL